MDYDLYFHDDFDGRASAAVMLDFFRTRGDRVRRFVPVNHDLKPRWEKIKFPRPTVVVDFPFHPKAVFWFDHHLTGFYTPAAKKKFRPSKFYNWKPTAPSACGVVIDALEKHFRYRAPAHLRELREWLDVIDAAKFRSPKQIIERKEPALQVDAYIDRARKRKVVLDWLIRLLAAQPLREVVRNPRLARGLRAARLDRATFLRFYRTHLIVRGRVSFIDLSETGRSEDLRFAPYYFYPETRYHTFLKRGSDGMFHVGLGVNPWHTKTHNFHVGLFLRERFGGGGHKNAGGADAGRTKTAAMRAVQEILSFLEEKTR